VINTKEINNGFVILVGQYQPLFLFSDNKPSKLYYEI